MTEQINAGARFLAEFGKAVPVAAAFWLVPADDSSGAYLYVTSDTLQSGPLDAAYAEVLRVASRMRDPAFDPFRVKLIKPDEPLARAALDLLRRFSVTTPTRLRLGYFGGVATEALYFYHVPVTVS